MQHGFTLEELGRCSLATTPLDAPAAAADTLCLGFLPPPQTKRRCGTCLWTCRYMKVAAHLALESVVSDTVRAATCVLSIEGSAAVWREAM